MTRNLDGPTSEAAAGDVMVPCWRGRASWQLVRLAPLLAWFVLVARPYLPLGGWVALGSTLGAAAIAVVAWDRGSLAGVVLTSHSIRCSMWWSRAITYDLDGITGAQVQYPLVRFNYGPRAVALPIPGDHWLLAARLRAQQNSAAEQLSTVAVAQPTSVQHYPESVRGVYLNAEQTASVRRRSGLGIVAGCLVLGAGLLWTAGYGPSALGLALCLAYTVGVDLATTVPGTTLLIAVEGDQLIARRPIGDRRVTPASIRMVREERNHRVVVATDQGDFAVDLGQAASASRRPTQATQKTQCLIAALRTMVETNGARANGDAGL